MKMTFEKLTAGQYFDLGIDADGHEPVCYKINATQAVCTGGPWMTTGREDYKSDDVVYTWDKRAVLHDAPTEVERAAFTVMLNQDGKPLSDHPALTAWVIAMATDANEARDLDTYIYETTELREFCQENGWIAPISDRYDRKRSAFMAILDYKPRGVRSETTESERWREYENATLRLADAIRSYRYAGRPDGDQESTIMGMGAPLARISTSLAAAIGEYHHALINICYGEQMELETALHEALPTDLITQTEAARIANITPQAINNAIASRRLRGYSKPDAISHRPGDRLVSEAEVRQLWPPRDSDQ